MIAKVAAVKNRDGSKSVYRLVKTFPPETHEEDILRYIRTLGERVTGRIPIATTATVARETDDLQFPRVQDLVIKDLEQRRDHGLRKYGVALRPFDGNVTSIEVYQELVDALIYFRQLIYEETGQ